MGQGIQEWTILLEIFKGYLPEILLGQFLNTLYQIFYLFFFQTEDLELTVLYDECKCLNLGKILTGTNILPFRKPMGESLITISYRIH